MIAMPPRCPYAHTRIEHASRADLRRSVLCLVNRARAEHGVAKLTESHQLDRSAQRWTDTMAHTGCFDHGAWAHRISATGFDWEVAGENIATGFTTPAAVVRAWMRSPGHRANILDPAYRQVGTGTARGYWTQDFGRRFTS